LPRAVHREHDGDGVGDARPCAAGVGDAAGGLRRAPRTGPARRRVAISCATAARCRGLVTRKALENAAAAVAATGGSTSAGLPPAIAHETGIRFTLDDVAEVFARTPLIGNLQPGGK
jgi:dihydroxyacid dehydratase/phosphogluconate dehydratase